MSLQDVTLQHYMDYTAESLIPVMAHIAKNVVKVNEGLTKHMVSSEMCVIWTFRQTDLGLDWLYPDTFLTQLFFFLQAIKGKYSTSKQMRIATLAQLKSSVVKDLAKTVTQWHDWSLAPCAGFVQL